MSLLSREREPIHARSWPEVCTGARLGDGGAIRGAVARALVVCVVDVIVPALSRRVRSRVGLSHGRAEARSHASEATEGRRHVRGAFGNSRTELMLPVISGSWEGRELLRVKSDWRAGAAARLRVWTSEGGKSSPEPRGAFPVRSLYVGGLVAFPLRGGLGGWSLPSWGVVWPRSSSIGPRPPP